MPKATMTFNLPEEKSEYELAISASDYLLCICDIVEKIRHKCKYEELTDAESKVWDEVKDMVWNILNENEIDPYR